MYYIEILLNNMLCVNSLVVLMNDFLYVDDALLRDKCRYDQTVEIKNSLATENTHACISA